MANKLKLSANNIINCILFAIIGILLLVLRSGSLGILFTVIGVLFIALGIYDLINKNRTEGAIETALGIIILVCGWTIAEWVLLIFGVLLIVKGIIDICSNYKNGLKSILSPIIITVIGIVLVVSRFALIDVMCIIAGIIFIIYAVLTLFNQKIS